MKNGRYIILILFVLGSAFVVSGCRSNKGSDTKISLSQDQLVNINRELVIKERERIESYIKRKGLDMKMTDAGIWYSISKNGEGDIIKGGDRVRLKYTCSLLDGTKCYSSEQDGDLIVVIGKSDIPSGLDEALRFLKKGAEAIIILPSNLAFGLIGDGDMIPARSALIYEIMVLP